MSKNSMFKPEVNAELIWHRFIDKMIKNGHISTADGYTMFRGEFPIWREDFQVLFVEAVKETFDEVGEYNCKQCKNETINKSQASHSCSGECGEKVIGDFIPKQQVAQKVCYGCLKNYAEQDKMLCYSCSKIQGIK